MCHRDRAGWSSGSRRWALVALCLLLPAAGSRAAVEVSASVDTAVAYVGDRIAYEFHVAYDAGDSVVAPPHGVNLSAFRVLDFTPLESTSNGRIREGGRYVLTAFRPGTYVVPPLPVSYWTAAGDSGELVTQAIPVEVRSVGVAISDSLRDIKPLVSIPLRFRQWVRVLLATVLALALAAAGVTFWLMRRKARANADTPRSVIIDEIAEFDRIPAHDLIAQGEIKRLYIAVSDQLRRYTERRYGVRAMELTYAELVHEFECAHIPRVDADHILDFLARCDLVKFAKLMPPDDEVVSLVDRAKEVVRRTLFQRGSAVVEAEPAQSATGSEAVTS